MAARRVLTVNLGASSVKTALYAIDTSEHLLGSVQVAQIGQPNAHLRARDTAGRVTEERAIGPADYERALTAALAGMPDHHMERLDAAAHRIVHGGDISEPQIVGPDLLSQLRRLVAVDPDHLPQAIAAIEMISQRYPDVAQIACFDTAFHRSLAATARNYPLPKRFEESGVRRYGFHGLSCEFIVSALREIDPVAADRRLIIAHLGSGASMTAVHHGQSLDTTMGFSPAGGLMMGTRTGDLDPGVLLYILREGGMTGPDLNRLVNRESGLLGVSGTSSDMLDLLARESTDARAGAAVELFCYLAKKALGALLVTLGGLETLVFTGGIGEHSAVVRQRIVQGLDELGLTLDAERNAAGTPVISAASSRVVVRVVGTNEDLVLARHACRLMTAGPDKAPDNA